MLKKKDEIEKCGAYTGYYGAPIPKLDYILLSPQQLYPILTENITIQLKNEICSTDDFDTLKLFGNFIRKLSDIGRQSKLECV